MEVDINPSDYSNTLSCGDQMLALGGEDFSGCSSQFDGNGEVSSIHLSFRNSKLECVDEHGQDSISSDLCPEDDEFSDFDEFNPYLFIKTLPDLSSVVPTFRPLLLPKQTRSCPPTTLVLDLDGKKIDTISIYPRWSSVLQFLHSLKKNTHLLQK